MFRLILSALAALVLVRVLVSLAQGIAAGLREGAGEKPVGDGRTGARGPRSARPTASGEGSRDRPVIDRDKVIDVPYTEVRDEEPSEAERESRAG